MPKEFEFINDKLTDDKHLYEEIKKVIQQKVIRMLNESATHDTFCNFLKTSKSLPDTLLKDVQQYLPENPTFYVGEGCKECGHSGYSGREMISEVLTISETFSRMIARSASKEEMTEQATKEGFINMFEDGVSKALEGKTTIEEIYRVARL